MPHRRETPSQAASMLCSALLVGMMLAADVARAYGRHRLAASERGTGAFDTSRSSDEPYALQHVRAGEPGRGRHAKAPWQIPLKGWKDIFWRTYQQIGEDSSPRGRGWSGILRFVGRLPGRHRLGFSIRPVRKPGSDQRTACASQWNPSRQRCRNPARANRPADRE